MGFVVVFVVCLFFVCCLLVVVGFFSRQRKKNSELNTNGKYLSGCVLLTNIRPIFNVCLMLHSSLNKFCCTSWLFVEYGPINWMCLIIYKT